jgi:cytochrome P450
MSESTPLQLAPGPRGLPRYGSFFAWDRDPLGFMVRAQRRYGDIVHFRLGREPVYLLSHPDHVKHVMVDHAANYTKPAGPPSPLVGNGLFKSEGEFWKKQRGLIQPAFHRERLTSWVDTIAGATQDMLARWRPRAGSAEPFDVAEEMARLACSLMYRIVFTEPQPDAVYEATRKLVYFIGHPERGLKARLPFLSTRRQEFRAALAELDAMAHGHIARRREEGSSRGDMLDFMMAAKDRVTGEGMSDAQLRDEAMNLYAAGYEATAAALAWAWYLLHQHPEAWARLHEEAVTVLGDRPPTAADLPRLRYASWVFEESMRLYPPAWLLDRQAREADRIGGHDVPAGSIMLMLPFILHRHPGLWENPEAFEPERFSPERSAKRSRFAFLPFGAGQRICIGKDLAMLKAPIILAMVARHFRIEVVRKGEPRLHAAVTLTLADGLPATLRLVTPDPRSEPRPAVAG